MLTRHLAETEREETLGEAFAAACVISDDNYRRARALVFLLACISQATSAAGARLQPRGAA